MLEVLVTHIGDLSLSRKSVVRLTDCPNMTLDVYRGRKTTIQQQCTNVQEELLHCPLVLVLALVLVLEAVSALGNI